MGQKKEEINIGLQKVGHVKYKGSSPGKTFLKIGAGVLGLTIVGGGAYYIYKRNLHKKESADNIKEYASNKEAEAQKHVTCVEADTQKYSSDRSADASSYAQKREADAALYRAKCEADVAKYNVLHAQKQVEPVEAVDVPSEAQVSWHDDFHQKYKIPQVPDPIVGSLLLTCPQGYEDAALCSLTAMFGAFCFSKVRARYLDGELHAPNLQVCVEADWGTGKGKINSLYKQVFADVITTDAQKLLSGGFGIIQNVGTGISSARLIDILASNKGVHAFMLEPEVRALTDCLKKGGGLTYEHLRKAYDNDTISRYNKQKKTVQGQFPVCLNYVVTGTPGDVAKFIGKELEGGTASRICWTVLPQAQRELSSLKPLEDFELKHIHERIREWREKYCYHIDEAGHEVVAKETMIDLDYVNSGLKVWLDSQWSESDDARNAARARIATTAFHHAIVFHLLNDCPDETQPGVRQQILALTVYVANLLMERFLHKFGQEQKLLKRNSRRAECVRTTLRTEKPGKPSSTLVEEWRTLHAQVDDSGISQYGWKKLHKLYPMYSPNTIKRYVQGQGSYA